MILPDGYSDIPAGKIAAIVTHLEMTERPALRPNPPGASAWTLRKVARPTTDWFRELYSRIGAEWMWYARMKLPDAELAAKIQSPGVDIYALMHDGRDEGLLELDFRQAGACEIGLIGITADLIGTGAGRFLINRALELAWSRDVQRVWLHTCSFDHPSALTFYQRSGFRPFRRQIVVGDDPRLDGTAPRDVAKHVPVIE
jgi:GNAT superfamily N-acetyltransferase